MAKQDMEEEEETNEAAPAPATSAQDLGRYPGDIVKDKKTGRKARFVNEYGTNGRAVIVVPDGQTRSELWDASTLEIIKRVKRPVQVLNAPTVRSEDDDDMGDDEEPAED